jgi:hypothetical protein
MTAFVVGTPVTTTTPTVDVTVDPAHPLPSGTHIFQLVVIDDQGTSSAPGTVQVVIKDRVIPTAVIRAPTQVISGQPFTLDGSASNEVPPGKIVQWVWTLMS